MAEREKKIVNIYDVFTTPIANLLVQRAEIKKAIKKDADLSKINSLKVEELTDVQLDYLVKHRTSSQQRKKLKTIENKLENLGIKFIEPKTNL